MFLSGSIQLASRHLRNNFRLLCSITHRFVEVILKSLHIFSVLISSISIWEIALLKKKGLLYIDDLHRWKNDLLANSGIIMVNPTSSDMIDSVSLPDHHKDPFDRLLIAQAINNNAIIVTRDKTISKYMIETFWK